MDFCKQCNKEFGPRPHLFANACLDQNGCMRYQNGAIVALHDEVLDQFSYVEKASDDFCQRHE